MGALRGVFTFAAGCFSDWVLRFAGPGAAGDTALSGPSGQSHFLSQPQVSDL